MRWIRVVVVGGILSFAAAHTAHRPAASPPPVGAKVERIRYADLAAHVKSLKGRVVVVDFWADYCRPCKLEFPKLVELHRKYARSGLTAISVSLDNPGDAEAAERVRQFLVKQDAACTNFLLDEKPELWQAKLKAQGPPCVFVFNRRGELLRVYRDGVDYAEIETLVIAALKE